METLAIAPIVLFGKLINIFNRNHNKQKRNRNTYYSHMELSLNKIQNKINIS